MGLTTHTAPSFSALYGLLGPVSTRSHDASTPGLSEVYPYRLEVWLGRMMNLIRQVSQWFLWILSSSSTFAQSSIQWLRDPPRPLRVLIPTMTLETSKHC